jgi:hypothetical protein
MTVLLRSHWRDGLRRPLARVHRHHAGVIQARRKRTGRFWQVRFSAVVHGLAERFHESCHMRGVVSEFKIRSGLDGNG